MNKSIPVTSACDKPQTPWLNVEDAIDCNRYTADPQDADKQIAEWKKEHP